MSAISNDDVERVKGFYEPLLNRYGPHDPRAMGWLSENNAEVRFEALAGIGHLDEETLLDVGCGTGAFLRYLLDRGISPIYTGVDLHEKAIGQAEKLHPGFDWEVADFGTFEERPFSYVVASGAMTFAVENYREHYFGWIEKMYRMATKGVAFNMLDQAWHAGDSTYAAYSKYDVREFCTTICDQVEVVDGYLDMDFTIFLRK